MQQPSYDIIIPSFVRYDPKLKDLSKLLLGEIYVLSAKTGKCWATNNYFAELYKVDKRTIVRCINELKDNNYIYCKNYYKENSKEIEKREITPSDKNDTRVVTKMSPGDDKNVTRGSDKNVTENINKNININNNSEMEKISEYDWINDD